MVGNELTRFLSYRPWSIRYRNAVSSLRIRPRSTAKGINESTTIRIVFFPLLPLEDWILSLPGSLAFPHPIADKDTKKTSAIRTLFARMTNHPYLAMSRRLRWHSREIFPGNKHTSQPVDAIRKQSTVWNAV